MIKATYENERVRIRPITLADTDLIIKWRNSDAVRQNFIYQKLFTKESHETWMKTMVEPGHVAQFIIEDIRTGTPVGSVYLRDIDTANEKAEFGIFLGDFRGKGYGTEATKLILQYAFETLNLHRVFLRVFADNTGAIRSYEKAGFVFEGRFRDDVKISGLFRDVVFMSIINKKEK